MKYLILMFLIVGCSSNSDNESTEIIEEGILCETIFKTKKAFYHYIVRCENSEVICYVNDGSRAGGLVCKFKGENNGR